MDALNELFLMQQAIGTLFSVTNKLQAVGDRCIKKLTVRQIMVMIAIIHLPGDRANLNNIARKLGTTKQNVRQPIAALERKGYVVTVPSEKDKRAVNAQITKEGREIFLSCGRSSLEYFADVFHEFSAEELELLWELLEKLYRFDGKKQDGFEQDVNYGYENGFSDVQLQEIQNFRARRIRDASNKNMSESERRGRDE
jgi:Transcriptional regulators